jgi:hypothetical protein
MNFAKDFDMTSSMKAVCAFKNFQNLSELGTAPYRRCDPCDPDGLKG